jgi:hypothetical protein
MACALFVRLISHQPAVLFSQNKSAISNQPAVLFSQNKPAPAISQTNRLWSLKLSCEIAGDLRRNVWIIIQQIHRLLHAPCCYSYTEKCVFSVNIGKAWVTSDNRKQSCHENKSLGKLAKSSLSSSR